MKLGKESKRKSERRCARAKRAESIWISYILLMGFSVVLGTMVYVWIVDYVKSSGEDVKKVVYNYADCDYISVSIDGACVASQILNMNVTNRNNLRVDALIIHVFDASGLPKVIELNVTIKPGKQKELKIAPNISNAASVQAVPVMYKGNMVIICNDKKTASSVAAC
jgi:hypothetical protein